MGGLLGVMGRQVSGKVISAWTSDVGLLSVLWGGL